MSCPRAVAVFSLQGPVRSPPLRLLFVWGLCSVLRRVFVLPGVQRQGRAGQLLFSALVLVLCVSLGMLALIPKA